MVVEGVVRCAVVVGEEVGGNVAVFASVVFVFWVWRWLVRPVPPYRGWTGHGATDVVFVWFAHLFPNLGWAIYRLFEPVPGVVADGSS